MYIIDLKKKKALLEACCQVSFLSTFDSFASAFLLQVRRQLKTTTTTKNKSTFTHTHTKKKKRILTCLEHTQSKKKGTPKTRSSLRKDEQQLHGMGTFLSVSRKAQH